MIPLYQVDAFCSEPFKGNPAAVCPLSAWLSDDLMQKIAMENNLSETVFFIPQGENYAIRWFTPTVEMDICGHATLAAAHVIFSELGYELNQIIFSSQSGDLIVDRSGDKLTMNFPTQAITESVPVSDEICRAIGGQPKAAWKSNRLLLEFNTEQELLALQPDYRVLATLCQHICIVTAPGSDKDFVSRVFAPALGIDEDPVTGGSFTSLVPFWAQRLQKDTLSARQVSARTGEVDLVYRGERVDIIGEAVTVIRGELLVDS